MYKRIDYEKIAPSAIEAMLALGRYVRASGLEPSLLNLVRIRVSQINGCAWCLDMHTKDAKAEGETDQRIFGLPAWPDSPFYTEREKAALLWTEAVTLVNRTHVPEKVYAKVRKYFSEKELVDLTFAIIAVNGWNRLNVAFRRVPGDYEPSRILLGNEAQKLT